MSVKMAEPGIEDRFTDRSRIDLRTVSLDDTKNMVANPGKWFEVETTAETARTVYQATRNLRINLPRWYGGAWSVRRIGMSIYVRYDGAAAKAA